MNKKVFSLWGGRQTKLRNPSTTMKERKQQQTCETNVIQVKIGATKDYDKTIEIIVPSLTNTGLN